ncbi:MAG TPA: hypothetical protein VGX49_08310 [Jatrophihabitans sp.]|nr:hypothetical protein [Jatrophihabitans sp.]
MPPLLIAMSLAGCGPAATDAGSPGVGDAAPPAAGNPAAALAKWRSFPVEADPRPLVLTRGTIIDPLSGFRSGEGKLAFLSGQFDLAVALPATPASSAGYAVISAKAALDQLRANSNGQPSASRLRVVTAALGQAQFGTDRGPRLLPAWRFGLDQVSDPVWVLAVDPKALWPAKPSSMSGYGVEATVGQDGRTLSYGFDAGPAGPPPCGTEYTASAVESATAVVVRLEQVAQQRPSSSRPTDSVACPAIGQHRTVTLRLASPLGGRVLLSPDGAPVPVLSS